MPILLKTQIERTAKAPIPACHARVGSLCDFQDTVERVPAGSPKTGRCTAVRERWRKMLVLARTAAGKVACGKRGTRQNGQNLEILDAATRKQPAMDLSRDKNAEEMKWSPLEMGAAMQAHGA